MGPVELAECFPVPVNRFRVAGQVSGAVIGGGRLPEIAPRQTGAADDQRNAPAAGCSHNRGRHAATLMIACGRAEEPSPAVNGISVSAG